jgi:hypothetical protein
MLINNLIQDSEACDAFFKKYFPLIDKSKYKDILEKILTTSCNAESKNDDSVNDDEVPSRTISNGIIDDEESEGDECVSMLTRTRSAIIPNSSEQKLIELIKRFLD